MGFSSSWLIYSIPRKLYTRNKIKLLNKFWDIWQKVWKLLFLAYGGSESGPRAPPSSVSIESRSSWLIKDILRKLHAWNKKSYWTDFEKFGKRCEKSIFVPFSSPFSHTFLRMSSISHEELPNKTRPTGRAVQTWTCIPPTSALNYIQKNTYMHQCGAL